MKPSTAPSATCGAANACRWRYGARTRASNAALSNSEAAAAGPAATNGTPVAAALSVLAARNVRREVIRRALRAPDRNGDDRAGTAPAADGGDAREQWYEEGQEAGVRGRGGDRRERCLRDDRCGRGFIVGDDGRR